MLIFVKFFFFLFVLCSFTLSIVFFQLYCWVLCSLALKKEITFRGFLLPWVTGPVGPLCKPSMIPAALYSLKSNRTTTTIWFWFTYCHFSHMINTLKHLLRLQKEFMSKPWFRLCIWQQFDLSVVWCILLKLNSVTESDVAAVTLDIFFIICCLI